MTPEQVEALLEAFATLAESLDQIRTWLIVISAALVPVWADVVFRSGWRCWLDLQRRREDRARRRRPQIQRRERWMTDRPARREPR